MAKTIIIKITTSGSKVGPFDILDQSGNVIASGISRESLIEGVTYSVSDDVASITLISKGTCDNAKTKDVGIVIPQQLASSHSYVETTCLWKHLTDETLFNKYYGEIEPYVIEYPFSYQYEDEILQNIQDFTKTYRYLPDSTGVKHRSLKVELDDEWFNKAVVYNGQQSSGILLLVAKPVNNLKEYLRYPLYNSDSKSIIFTKSDNFYQYNTFWSVVKDSSQPLFVPTCESLSIDKIVNQSNMNYTHLSFNKAPLRAKDLKVRHILDNKSDLHLVSQFIVAPAQISYK